VWHELGHATATALGVRDKILNEGVAIICKFKGLLLEAEEGKFLLERAFDQIEFDIEKTEDPPNAMAVASS